MKRKYFFFLSELPSADEAMQNIPPLLGMPVRKKKRNLGLDNYQVLFSALDTMVYEELVKPYLELFREMLQNYSTNFRGPFGKSWAAEPHVEPLKRFLEGNEMASKKGVFHRSSYRAGEGLGENEFAWQVRTRKTVTNMWLTARYGPFVRVCRSKFIRRPVGELRQYMKELFVNPGDPFVFFGDIGESAPTGEIGPNGEVCV